MVVIILGEGFEETEAVAPWDILRRGGVDVALAGVGGREVTGSHGLRVTADMELSDVDADKVELVVVPGGLRGVQTIKNSPEALALISRVYENGKRVAAICAGPTVLGQLGIMEGKRGVCYPGMEGEVAGAEMSQETSVVIHGTVTTGRAAGASLDFGLTLLKELKGEETARKVASGICYSFD